jgi:RND superfamily putative drug exporter
MARSQPRTSLLERWARFAHRRRGRVIGVWMAALVAVLTLSAFYGGEFDSGFEMPGTESQEAIDLLEDNFPERAGSDGELVFKHEDGVEDPAVRARIDQIIADVRQVPGVTGVESPYESQGFINDDGTIARGVIHFSEVGSDVPKESIDRLFEVVDDNSTNGLQAEVGGDVIYWNEEPDFSSEWIGLAIAAVILLIAFGSVVAMGLPLVTALAGLFAGFSVIALGANVFNFPDFSPAFAAMIGLGVGIDYSLLVVTRFREGLHAGMTVEDALVKAVGTSGRAVIFAGIVVTISFLGLWVMGLPFVGALGTAGAIVVLMAVLVALTLMPALLSLTGHRIDRWKVPMLHSTEGVDKNSGWYRMAKGIQARPLPVFLGSTAILLFLAIPILDMDLGFTDAGNQPESYHSRQAYDLQKEGFGPGFNAPLVGVVDLSETPENERQGVIENAVTTLQGVENVALVTEPVLNEAGDTAIITFLSGTSPQDNATDDLVHRVRDEARPLLEQNGANFLLTGGVASNVDSGDRITERMPYLFIGVIGLSFLLLMVVFRSVLVALKAAVMNLLSIGAAYGVVVAVFQWGWGADLIGVQEGPVETFLPMMLFAILFGLSMDYEVFLISRIREEYVNGNDNATAVAYGLTATARVITAAAAIMVAVFGSFILGADRIIKEFGLGLAVAILVDATIVRLFLVPATMELLGERNWWMPKWLDRILPHVNVEGAETPTRGRPVGAPAGGK